MTREQEKPETVRKVVVIFDISSSTTILEDLKRSDNLTVWRNFHINLKTFLQEKAVLLEMEMYKFMGDGWILLFQPNIYSRALFDFLGELTSFVMLQFVHVQRLLHSYPEPTGLTFGIDTGELIRLEMNDQIEYLGRAINVAARLQGEAKGFAGKALSNIALFSKASFNSLEPYDGYIKAENKIVALRNISGGNNFPCYLVSTLAQGEAQENELTPDTTDHPGTGGRNTTHSPGLVITQKKDSGYFGIKRQSDGSFFVYVTLLITNLTEKPNSVLEYKAEIMRTDGNYEKLKIEQGEIDERPFCVTPLNIPPSTTIESVLGFISVHPAKYGQPFKMKVAVIDVYGNEFPGTVRF